MSRWLVLVPLLAAGACTTPRPQPAPIAAARPVPAAVVPPITGDWRDVALTAGTWSYRAEAGGSNATFGRAGSAADFTIRCVRPGNRIQLARAGMAGGALTLTTSYGPMRWLATATGTGTSMVELAGADPSLDRIAFSRGRFTVEAAGLPLLVLPAWAEPARVIEDCRG